MGFLLFLGVVLAAIVLAGISCVVFVFVVAIFIEMGNAFIPIFVTITTIIWIFVIYYWSG